MKISEKLPILRKRSGLSQEDLANELDVSRQSVYKWETGESKPEIEKIQKLAKILGVSFDYLLDENIDITKVDDVPNDRVADIKYRQVFVSNKDLEFEQADYEHGVFEKDSYDENPKKSKFFILQPSIVRREEIGMELATQIFEENKKKAEEYLNSKGYQYEFLQNDICAAFFYDTKQQTIGFYYCGAEQFVCPIENLVDFTYDMDERGVPGVSLELTAPATFDITVRYINQDETAGQFNLSLMSTRQYVFCQEKYKTSESQRIWIGVGAYTEGALDRIVTKIKVAQRNVDKIASGKIKVEELDLEALAQNVKTGEQQEAENFKQIKEKILNIVGEKDSAKNKKTSIKLVVGLGIFILIIVLGVLLT